MQVPLYWNLVQGEYLGSITVSPETRHDAPWPKTRRDRGTLLYLISNLNVSTPGIRFL